MRYSNAAVRQFLRRLKRPAELESVPLARALRHALGTGTTFEAARLALKAAFARCGPAGARYQRIIWEYDVERAMTREQAADELGVSPRQFFRMRSEAVQAFADYIAELLAGPEATRDPVDDAARALVDHDPGAAADLLVLSRSEDAGRHLDILHHMAASLEDIADIDPSAFHGNARIRAQLLQSFVADLRGEHARASDLRAQSRAERQRYPVTADRTIDYEEAMIEYSALRMFGMTDELLDRAEALERIGKDIGGEHAIGALLVVAEAAIVSGRPGRAREAIDIAFYSARERRYYRLLGLALLRQSEVELLERRPDDAMRLARAAAIALRAYPDGRAHAESMIGRLSAMLGLSWETAEMPSANLWLSLAIRGLHARCALAQPERNEAAAQDALAIATEAEWRGYLGVAAYNFATAGLASLAGGAESANYTLLRAWLLLLQTRNHLIAQDIFVAAGNPQRDFGPLLLDEHAADTMARAIVDIPAMGSLGRRGAASAMAPVWSLALRIAAGTIAAVIPAEFADAVADVLVRDGVTAGTFEHVGARALREIATWTSAFLDPEERNTFARRLTRTLRTFQYQVERAVAQARYRIASSLSAS